MKKILSKFFRCPYHALAKKNNQLIEVTLSENQGERFTQLETAFNRFYLTPELKAIMLTMPNSLTVKCKSLVDIKEKILPYQCKLLATEFHLRLYPFLPYQSNFCDKQDTDEIMKADPLRQTTAYSFVQALKKAQYRTPNNITELSILLLVIMKNFRALGTNNGAFTPGQLLEIFPSGLILPYEFTGFRITDATKNKNMFSFITSPFYPKEFGRYSKNHQIVITRYADLKKIPQKNRDLIRTHNNTVLQQGGVIIENIELSKQSDGVWIP